MALVQTVIPTNLDPATDICCFTTLIQTARSTNVDPGTDTPQICTTGTVYCLFPLGHSLAEPDRFSPPFRVRVWFHKTSLGQALHRDVSLGQTLSRQKSLGQTIHKLVSPSSWQLVLHTCCWNLSWNLKNLENRNLRKIPALHILYLLENVEHCGGEPEQADTGISCHWWVM